MPGARCAVAVCNNSYETSNRRDPNVEDVVRYHRFPQDIETRKKWIVRCRRKGKWNPDSCRICSEHFTDEDYARDLKAELMNLPKRWVLKRDAVPSRNLGKTFPEVTQSSESKANSRSERQDRRFRKKLVNDILLAVPNKNDADNLPVQPPPEIRDEAKEQAHNDHVDVVELRSKLQDAQKEVKRLQLQVERLKRNVKEARLSQKEIPPRLYSALREIFTDCQIDLLTKKKQWVEWSKEDMEIAFALRCTSKRAYTYLQKKLHYPFPGISTLHRWVSKNKVGNTLLNFTPQWQPLDVCEPSNTDISPTDLEVMA